MAKTVLNLTDTFSQLVTKVNQISDDLGDIQGVHFYDSSVAGMLIAAKQSADSTNNIAVRAALSTGTPKNLDFDSATGQFNLLFDSAQAKKLISVNASGTGTLSYNDTNGEITYVGATTDLVADTTPQLGGDLDVNGKRIKLADHTAGVNNRIVFGADSDLKIYHDASNSYIEDAGTGNLNAKGSTVQLMSTGGQSMVKAVTGGTVELYHNGTKKLETESLGVEVSGTLTATALNINGTGITASGAEINLLDLGTNQQLGIFKVSTSVPSSASDFTGNTKLIMVY
jgi:hypothetical protein